MQWVCKPSNSWSASAGRPKWLTSGGRGRPGGQTSAEETAGWSASVTALLLLPETPTRNPAWTAACNCNRSLSFIFRQSLLILSTGNYLGIISWVSWYPDWRKAGDDWWEVVPLSSTVYLSDLLSLVEKGEKVRMKIFPATVLLTELRPRYIPCHLKLQQCLVTAPTEFPQSQIFLPRSCPRNARADPRPDPQLVGREVSSQVTPHLPTSRKDVIINKDPHIRYIRGSWQFIFNI